MKKNIHNHLVEWDDRKAQHNKEKHGLSFDTAALVFNDPHRLEFYDADHSNDEDRYITLGLVHKVLFVVYTERHEYIRIISARTATSEERRIYYGDCTKDYL